MSKVVRDILITLVLAAVIFLLLHLTMQSIAIYEQCMEPNFHEGERVLVIKAAYWFHEPERGDVVILHPPFPHEFPYIKRIIAIPGDTVEITGGVVYVNGQPLDESEYIMEPPIYTLPLTTIPEGEYFVLGDNRNNANDSHTGWTVPEENIIGKAWLTFWPFSEWGVVDHYPLAEQLESPEDE